MSTQRITSLDALLDRLEEAAVEREQVSLGRVLEVVGRGSFGPSILVAGLVTLAPVVGDIPGVPTLVGVVVVATSIQVVLGRGHFWLPQWLLRRSVAASKLCKAVARLRRPAGFVDRFIGRRFPALTQGAGATVVAVACTFVGLAMPVMELVPFSANLAGASLTAFGLSLIARDGVLAVIALVLTAGTAALALEHLVL
jgi:hypothetical protein